MTREQMRAALQSANIISANDNALSIGVALASTLNWVTTKAASSYEDSKGIVDGIAVGFAYQRALDQKLITK